MRSPHRSIFRRASASNRFRAIFVTSSWRMSSVSDLLLRSWKLAAAVLVWLPYFRQVLGWRAAGVDYSPSGCALARRVLDRAGVDVPVHYCDLFAPLPDLVETFDAVVSFGVVEHFVPTSRVIGALAQFIRPGAS